MTLYECSSRGLLKEKGISASQFNSGLLGKEAYTAQDTKDHSVVISEGS